MLRIRQESASLIHLRLTFNSVQNVNNQCVGTLTNEHSTIEKRCQCLMTKNLPSVGYCSNLLSKNVYKIVILFRTINLNDDFEVSRIQTCIVKVEGAYADHFTYCCQGSGCGSVDRVVSSNTRGLWFESNHLLRQSINRMSAVANQL